MLYRIQSTALGQSGNTLEILPNATVSVMDASGAVARIYADADQITELENPTTADNSGGYDFYVDFADYYDISISLNGKTVDERVYTFSLDRLNEAELSAATDAEKTALDALQTAADVVLTGLDVEAIAEDAAQTALDAAQTAADAVQTGLDATAAETARDAAFVNADVYADTATGLAAVAEGEQFQVVSGDEIIRYRDDAGVATEVARYPSAGLVSGIKAITDQFDAFGTNFETIGLPPVTGTGVSTNRTYQLRTGATYASNVTAVRLWSMTAGTLKIKTFTAPSAGNVTMVSEVEVTAVVGLNTFSGLTGLTVPVGGYIGFFCPTGQAQVAYVSGSNGGYFNQSGDTTGTTALGTANTSFRLSIEFDLARIAVPAANLSAAVSASIANGTNAGSRVDDLAEQEVLLLGYAPEVGDAGFSNGRIWWHVKDQAQSRGVLSQVRLWADATGSIKVKVLSDPIDGTATVLDEIPLEITSVGLNTFALSPQVEVPRRAALGIYQSSDILKRNSAVTGSPLYFPSGDTAVGATVSVGSTQQAGTISVEYTVQFEAIEENTIKRKPRLKGWNGVGVYGQSFAEGVSAGPALSLTQPYENLTFGSGPRSGKAGSTSGAVNTSPGVSTSKPLVEDDVSPSAAGNTDVGETPCAGLANEAVTMAALDGSLSPDEFVIFASCPAKGAQSIANLSKGAVWYQQLIDHIRGQYDLATAAGKTYAMQCVAWMQGEADANNGVSRATYKAAMVQLQQQIDSDAKAITGQTEDVIMLSYQTREFGTIAQRKEIALAQWESARESNGKIVIAGPIYHLEISAAHLTNVGSQRFGRTLGRAYKQIVADEVAPDTLNPKSCTAVGTALTMRFDVPTLPLVFDTVEISALTDMGFHVFDDTGDLTLSSIAIDGSTVTMTVNRALDANPKIAYATKYGAPSGNLRDSSGRLVTIDGADYGQQHWSPAFELPVVTLE